MTLHKYLKTSRLTQSEFAELANLSPAVLSQILAGHRQPSFNTLVRIHNTTNGRVCFRDLAGPRLVTYKGEYSR